MTFQRPYDEIGIDVSDSPNVSEALETAGLDFTIETRQGYFKSKGKDVEAQGYYYIIRTDTLDILGQCKGRFVPLQNSVLVEIAQPLLDQKRAAIDTIGSFDNGARVWILLKLIGFGHNITVDDYIEHYLLLMNGHDASTSIQMGIIPFRLACTNMLHKVGGHMEKFKHTETAEEMVKYFHQKLLEYIKQIPDHMKELRSLVEINCDRDQFIVYARKIFFPNKKGDLPTRSGNIINRLVDLFEKGRGQHLVRGTAYAAYNAISEYLNYEYGREQGSRISSLWFGANSKTLEKAFKYAKDI